MRFYLSDFHPTKIVFVKKDRKKSGRAVIIDLIKHTFPENVICPSITSRKMVFYIGSRRPSTSILEPM